MRNDAKEQVASAKNSFFETHSTIQAVVYKQVMRGNFGHSTMWDHRGAVYQDSYGEMVNATEKHSAIGMSSYISFSKQKIMKTEFSRSLSTEGVSTLIEYMLNGKFSPRETYSQLIAHEKNKSITPHFRIEIETNNYLKEASSIAHQLIGTKGIFNQANIDFAISSSRKIST